MTARAEYLHSNRSAGQIVRHGLEQITQLAGLGQQGRSGTFGAHHIDWTAAVQILCTDSMSDDYETATYEG